MSELIKYRQGDVHKINRQQANMNAILARNVFQSPRPYDEEQDIIIASVTGDYFALFATLLGIHLCCVRHPKRSASLHGLFGKTVVEKYLNMQSMRDCAKVWLQMGRENLERAEGDMVGLEEDFRWWECVHVVQNGFSTCKLESIALLPLPIAKLARLLLWDKDEEIHYPFTLDDGITLLALLCNVSLLDQLTEWKELSEERFREYFMTTAGREHCPGTITSLGVTYSAFKLVVPLIKKCKEFSLLQELVRMLPEHSKLHENLSVVRSITKENTDMMARELPCDESLRSSKGEARLRRVATIFQSKDVLIHYRSHFDHTIDEVITQFTIKSGEFEIKDTEVEYRLDKLKEILSNLTEPSERQMQFDDAFDTFRSLVEIADLFKLLILYRAFGFSCKRVYLFPVQRIKLVNESMKNYYDAWQSTTHKLYTGTYQYFPGYEHVLRFGPLLLAQMESCYTGKKWNDARFQLDKFTASGRLKGKHGTCGSLYVTDDIPEHLLLSKSNSASQRELVNRIMSKVRWIGSFLADNCDLRQLVLRNNYPQRKVANYSPVLLLTTHPLDGVNHVTAMAKFTAVCICAERICSQHAENQYPKLYLPDSSHIYYCIGQERESQPLGNYLSSLALRLERHLSQKERKKWHCGLILFGNLTSAADRSLLCSHLLTIQRTLRVFHEKHPKELYLLVQSAEERWSHLLLQTLVPLQSGNLIGAEVVTEGLSEATLADYMHNLADSSSLSLQFFCDKPPSSASNRVSTTPSSSLGAPGGGTMKSFAIQRCLLELSSTKQVRKGKYSPHPLAIISEHGLDNFLQMFNKFITRDDSTVWVEGSSGYAGAASEAIVEELFYQLLVHRIFRSTMSATSLTLTGKTSVLLELHVEKGHLGSQFLSNLALATSGSSVKRAPDLRLDLLPHVLPETNDGCCDWYAHAESSFVSGKSLFSSLPLRQKQRLCTFFHWLYHDSNSLDANLLSSTVRKHSVGWWISSSILFASNFDHLSSTLLRSWFKATPTIIQKPVVSQLISAKVLYFPSLVKVVNGEWPPLLEARPSQVGSDVQAHLRDLLEEVFGEGSLTSVSNQFQQFVFSPLVLIRLLILAANFCLGLPLILQSETGVGKTRTIQIFSALVQHCYKNRNIPFSFHVLDMHPSMDRLDIEHWIESSINTFVEAGSEGMMSHGWRKPPSTLLFMDEINCGTGGILDVMRGALLDRRLTALGHVKRIPSTTWFIAACNPCQEPLSSGPSSQAASDPSSSSSTSTSSLALSSNSAAPLSSMPVYSVLPLPVSLQRIVWDIQSFDSEDFEYIVRQKLHSWNGDIFAFGGSARNEFLNPTAERVVPLVIAAHQLSRLAGVEGVGKEGTRLSRNAIHRTTRASFRELERLLDIADLLNMKACATLVRTSQQEMKSKKENPPWWFSITAGVAVAYLSRIDRKAKETMIEKCFPKQNSREARLLRECLGAFKCLSLSLMQSFSFLRSDQVIETEALQELFLTMFLHVVAKIPLFVVGAAGTSKSFALTLLAQCLRSAQFKHSNSFLKDFPQFSMLVLQCSKDLSETALAGEYERANEFMGTVDCKEEAILIVLEELGLAGDKSNVPSLKILHRLLDKQAVLPSEKRVAFIALSNTYLDAAKMNRGTILHLDSFTPSDFTKIAKCVIEKITQSSLSPSFVQSLSKELVSLFEEARKCNLFRNNTSPIGSRDFYDLLHLAVKQSDENVKSKGGCAFRLASSLMQQFAGKSSNTRLLQSRFQSSDIFKTTLSACCCPSPLQMLQESFKGAMNSGSQRSHGWSLQSRYTLCLTEMPFLSYWMAAAMTRDTNWRFTSATVRYQPRTAVGTRTMEKDRMVDELIKWMREGRKVLLQGSPDILHSLLDVINGHTIFTDAQTSHRFVRVAFKCRSMYIGVHPSFTLCVIASPKEAMYWPEPVLHRLQKIHITGDAVCDHIIRDILRTCGAKETKDLMKRFAVQLKSIELPWVELSSWRLSCLSEVYQIATSESESNVEKMLESLKEIMLSHHLFLCSPALSKRHPTVPPTANEKRGIEDLAVHSLSSFPFPHLEKQFGLVCHYLAESILTVNYGRWSLNPGIQKVVSTIGETVVIRERKDIMSLHHSSTRPAVIVLSDDCVPSLHRYLLLIQEIMEGWDEGDCKMLVVEAMSHNTSSEDLAAILDSLFFFEVSFRLFLCGKFGKEFGNFAIPSVPNCRVCVLSPAQSLSCPLSLMCDIDKLNILRDALTLIHGDCMAVPILLFLMQYDEGHDSVTFPFDSLSQEMLETIMLLLGSERIPCTSGGLTSGSRTSGSLQNSHVIKFSELIRNAKRILLSTAQESPVSKFGTANQALLERRCHFSTQTIAELAKKYISKNCQFKKDPIPHMEIQNLRSEHGCSFMLRAVEPSSPLPSDQWMGFLPIFSHLKEHLRDFRFPAEEYQTVEANLECILQLIGFEDGFVWNSISHFFESAYFAHCVRLNGNDVRLIVPSPTLFKIPALNNSMSLSKVIEQLRHSIHKTKKIMEIPEELKFDFSDNLFADCLRSISLLVQNVLDCQIVSPESHFRIKNTKNRTQQIIWRGPRYLCNKETTAAGLALKRLSKEVTCRPLPLFLDQFKELQQALPQTKDRTEASSSSDIVQRSGIIGIWQSVNSTCDARLEAPMGDEHEDFGRALEVCASIALSPSPISSDFTKLSRFLQDHFQFKVGEDDDDDAGTGITYQHRVTNRFYRVLDSRSAIRKYHVLLVGKTSDIENLTRKILQKSTRNCGVCYSTYGYREFVECSQGHLACISCFNNSFKTVQSDTKLGQPCIIDGRVQLQCGAEDATEGKATKLPDYYLRYLDAESWAKYMECHGSIIRSEEGIKYRKELEREREKWENQSQFEREVNSACRYIENDLLCMKCPRCQNVFEDYSGCAALTCLYRGCGANFCAYCFKDTNGDAHAHVQAEHGNYFLSTENFAKVCDERRKNSVHAFFKRLLEQKSSEMYSAILRRMRKTLAMSNIVVEEAK